MSVTDIKVGLLAYGAIGDEHSIAIQATPGLIVQAVCDTKPERLAAALELSPDAQTFTDAQQMLSEGGIDLVVISTPPNSHYTWAKEALTRGLHVMLEKPMALTTKECDELMALATTQGLLLVVYQNRRYDVDFLTIKDLIQSDQIGELFHYESFVGGYSKPCSFWHSDAAVSGGAIFDWGSHFIDQIMTLVPADVDFVSGLNQKRVWDHVTNADHAQVTINFKGGLQAVFINSDLAAARKPKFYLLGTKGALIGDWDESAGGPVADLPAIITLHRADGSSQVISHVSQEPYAFYASVVAKINDGVAMSVVASQSRDVVAILQAAEESALANGKPVSPLLLRT
ncbi:MAG: Gfo/Idh/MocA family oxidoreductase [Actinobacteria bacterium]|nr:Gfo/Idh/MocA family oxidoreductase [Actinomycetota bacterium]